MHGWLIRVQPVILQIQKVILTKQMLNSSGIGSVRLSVLNSNSEVSPIKITNVLYIPDVG